MTTSETLRLLDKTTAYWYACGYNDHRTLAQPYIDPQEFAEHWASVNSQLSRPSLQDAFKAFAAAPQCFRCGGDEVITVAVAGPDYFGNYDTDEVACPECQGEEA